ncbi:MAG: SdrD B-like domain-containing protein [Chloroflexota bacterium]
MLINSHGRRIVLAMVMVIALIVSTAAAPPLQLTSLDYGDLPDASPGTSSGNYETLNANSGPSHIIIPNLQIGSTVDPDIDGQQSTNANGDDIDTEGDDEDGVTIFPTLFAGQNTTIPVDVTNNTGSIATLYGYIDWNNDGDLDGIGESFTVTVPDGTNGSVSLNVTVPIGAAIGTNLGARFRLSTNNSLTSTGAATDGEVEDYFIRVRPQPATLTITKEATPENGDNFDFTINLGLPFINEIHYANVGSDSGEEFVEIAGPAGFDLTGWQLAFYNGSNGNRYGSILNLSGTIDDEGNGTGALAFPQDPIQNGAPDGIALIDDNGNVIQFLSYEGSFTANNSLAAGLISTDIGVFEPDSTPTDESLQLTGTGTQGSDFSWNSPAPDSPGSLNAGQTYALISFQLDDITPNTDDGINQSITFNNVFPGAYVIAETVPGGWSLTSASCTGGADSGILTGDTLSVALVSGENVTCTFNNNASTGKLTIVKDADPADGTQFAFEARQNGNLLGSFDLVNGQSFATTLNAGVYDITEVLPAGWALTGVTCIPSTHTTAIADGVQVDLHGDDDITCTFENDLDPSSIGGTIFEDTDGSGTQNGIEPGIEHVTVQLIDKGPDSILGTADDTIVGTDTTDSNGNYLFDNLPAGNYAVIITDTADELDGRVQTADPDATLDDMSMITLAQGEDNLDQDFGYQPQAAVINLQKTVYQGHDSGANCEGLDLYIGNVGDLITYCFKITNTGSTHLNVPEVVDPDLGSPLTIPIPVVDQLMAPGGTVTVFYETTLTADLVNTASVTGNPVDSGGNDIPTLSDVTDDDPAEVRVGGSINIIKSATANPALNFSFTGNLGDFNLVDGQNNLASNLIAGTYRVTELRLASNPLWALISVSCVDSQTSAMFTLPITQTDTGWYVDISLVSGQSLTCTFINDEGTFDPDMGDVSTLELLFFPLTLR